MLAITPRQSAALQRFIATVQNTIGRLMTLPTMEIPRLLIELSELIPQGLSPVAERRIRDTVVEVAVRIEAVLQLPNPSDCFSHRLGRLMAAAPSETRQALGAYAAVLADRLAVTTTREMTDARVGMAVGFISLNHANASLAIADVAIHVRLSKWHLDRLLRRHTGRCFVAHLHEARLNATKSLLLDCTQTIKKIASAAGYSSVTVLDRHFRREFGCTPRVWRREHFDE